MDDQVDALAYSVRHLLPQEFTYWGVPLVYADYEYNTTRLNERAVEIPIARWFLDQVGGEGLELGNVLSHYQPVAHRVVDRYELDVGARAENLDVFDLVDRFDWIVAISTLEHVRWDEEPKNAEGAGLALRHLQSLLRPGGRMLVTVPFGWHPFLDKEILDHRFTPTRECTLIRVAGTRRWTQTHSVTHRRYARSTMWAEAVWVAEFEAQDA